MADGGNQEANEQQEKTDKQDSSEDKVAAKKDSGANMDSPVQVFEALPPQQQQILHNAAEELITQQFLQPQLHQQPQQQQQQSQPRQQQQQQNQKFRQPFQPQQRRGQQQHLQQQQSQQQQTFLQSFQLHQRREQVTSTSSSSHEERMHGVNPGGWLNSIGGEDVELGANVVVESSGDHEGMEVDQQDQDQPSGAESLTTLERPSFLQQLGVDPSALEGGQLDMQFQSGMSDESTIWDTIGADITSFLSSHSSGEEQRVSLGTVLDVLGINSESARETEPSPLAQIVPNPTPQQADQQVTDDMVLSNRVMWAPPQEAQAYIRQQENIAIVSPPPLPYPAAADLPVPQAISALPQQAQMVQAVTSPVSPPCITNAPTYSSSTSTSATSAMSTQDSPHHASSSTASAATVPQPKLPEYHEMLVRGYYRQQEVFKTSVETPNGCVLFYRQPQQSPEEELTNVTLVQFPEVPEGVPEKNAQYTQKILDVVEKGVRIRCDNGYIYATRRCRSKVFVCTSQDMKGDSKELTRDQETMVFNPYLFEKRFRKWLLRQSDDVNIPRPPNIVITFAQRWNWTSHHPLMNCLVYAVVTPMRARTQLAWGPGSNEAVDSLNRDYRSSMLQISSQSQPSTGPGTSSMQTS